MSTSLTNAFTTDEIVENMGITCVYKLRRGIINKHKGVQNYYEVKCVDVGFKIDNNAYISLVYDVGTCFDMGNSFDTEEFAVGFETFSELSSRYGGFDSKKILTEYKKRVGKCYVWNFEKKDFEEIKNREFLKRHKKEETKANDLDILDMYDVVRQTIVAQDEQVKQILASVYKNQKIINSTLDDETISKLKENIIIYGPTGTGKTEILKQIAKVCNVPIVIEDVTAFTESGYVGRNVSEMITDLYSAAGMDLEFAESGILVIDEFDKLAEGGMEGNGDGPSRNGVQRSLLKLLDGGIISFKEDYESENSMDFNTSKLTVVALGAFSGIRKNGDYSDVITNDFIDYGIMREVMGRFSKLISMNEFSREDYKRILLESNLSPINTYQKLFDELGIKFTYDDDLIDYVIDEAIALECGARSLKTVFDGIVSDSLFNIFAESKKEVHLSIPKEKNKSYVAKRKASENKKRVGF